MILVHMDQDNEEVIRNVRQDSLRGQNNLAHMVKNILAQNGLIVGVQGMENP